MPLGVREHNKPSLEESSETLENASPAMSSPISKSRRPIERKIEGAWHESAKLGWSLPRFTAVMLEVLIVLQERDKLKAAKAKQQIKGV
jgi:hypothetical protein